MSTAQQLIISTSVIEAWESLTARFFIETGGMLLGQISRSEILITEATGPGPNSSRRRWSYEPDQEWDVANIRRAWDESGGRRRYLGEWHTHPVPYLKPSPTDVRTMRKIAEDPRTVLAEPFSAILNRLPGRPVSWRLYRFSAGRLVRVAPVVV